MGFVGNLVLFPVVKEQSYAMSLLYIERCVGLREGSGVERPCAMIFTLLGL